MFKAYGAKIFPTAHLEYSFEQIAIISALEKQLRNYEENKGEKTDDNNTRTMLQLMFLYKNLKEESEKYKRLTETTDQHLEKTQKLLMSWDSEITDPPEDLKRIHYHLHLIQCKDTFFREESHKLEKIMPEVRNRLAQSATVAQAQHNNALTLLKHDLTNTTDPLMENPTALYGEKEGLPARQKRLLDSLDGDKSTKTEIKKMAKKQKKAKKKLQNRAKNAPQDLPDLQKQPEPNAAKTGPQEEFSKHLPLSCQEEMKEQEEQENRQQRPSSQPKHEEEKKSQEAEQELRTRKKEQAERHGQNLQ